MSEPQRLWVDANLIVRILTDDPPEMAARAEAFMARAEGGEFSLVLCPLVLAECVWVLTRFYKLKRAEVAGALEEVLSNEGFEVLEAAVLRESLRRMAAKNVDFTDAYLAVRAEVAGEAVASFDADFKKLGGWHPVP